MACRRSSSVAETQRTAAQALVQFARASRRLANFDAAWEASSEAVTILEQQRKTGDESEATIIGLARALDVQALILNGRQDSQATALSQRGADVIGTLTKRPDASAAARETECEVLTTLGYLQTTVADPKAVATLRKALQLATELGGRDVKDTYVSALYTDAGAWLTVGLLIEGRYDEARAVGEDASKVADGILAQRPGDRIALYALALMQQSLGDASVSELQPQAAIAPYFRAAVVQQTLVDFDPKNIVAQNNLASVQWSTAEAYWTMGQVDDALEMLDATRTTGRIAGEGGTWSRLGQLRFLSHTVMRNADAGHFDKARDIVDEIGLAYTCAPEERTQGKPRGPLCRTPEAPGGIEDRHRARRRARGPQNLHGHECAAPGDAGDGRSGPAIQVRPHLHGERREGAIRARLEGIRGRRAERPGGACGQGTLGRRSAAGERVKAGVSTLHCTRPRRAGQAGRGPKVIEPVVKLHRELASRNRGDEIQKVEMAAALYAQALADPQRRSALLRESRSLLEGLPGPVKSLVSTRTWADRVRAASG